MNCGWVPPVNVSVVGSKCCHLKLEIIFQYDDHAKMRADRIGSWKKSLHRFRPCVGGNVVVFWRQTTDHVAHTPAGEVRDVPLLAQAGGDFARPFFPSGRVYSRSGCAW